MKIFEDLTMFEQRILCQELPSSFNSITIINNEEHCVIKRNKMVQDLKRQMLNVKLEQYELKIQHYEHLYLSSYKTVVKSNSLQRIMFSCQITTSSPTPQISISKQNNWCVSTNHCRRSKSEIESKSIRLSFTYRSVTYPLNF